MSTSGKDVYIVHQIWLQGRDKAPEEYQKYFDQYEKLTTQTGGTYMFWDEEKILQLIKRVAPWLEETYLSYEFWVMRADLGRYVIVYEYGGFYVDADTIPQKSFKDLIKISKGFPLFEVTFRATENLFAEGPPVSNSFFYMPQRRMEMMKIVLNEVSKYAKRTWYDFKLTHIVYGTGPIFLSNAIALYNGPVTLITTEKLDEFFLNKCAMTWMANNIVDWHDRYLLLFAFALVALIILAIAYNPHRK